MSPSAGDHGPLGRVVAFLIRNELLVHLIKGLVIVAGVLVALRSTREAYPNASLNLVFVSATLPGAAPSDVRTKLTLPLEAAVRKVDGVDTYQSTSMESVSFVEVTLHEDLDDDEVDAVERKLQQELDAISDLPAAIDGRPRLFRAEPAKMPVLEIALTGPPDATRRAADELKTRLEAVDTVADVTLVGYREPEMEIAVDPARARAAGVAAGDVMEAVRRRHQSVTGGTLGPAGEKKLLVVDREVNDPGAIGEALVRANPGGSVVRVRDVARVTATLEDTGMLAHFGGEPAILVVVRKRTSADIIDAVDAIRARVEATPLPDGVRATAYNDLSQLTRKRLAVLRSNGLLGSLLVACLLLLFVGWRASLAVAFGVPFSLLAVVACLPFFGININLISVAGMVLVLGILVDDAIVVAEHITTLAERGVPRVEAACQGVRDMFLPVLASSATTVIAFLPMLALRGMPGRFSWAMPVIVALALTFSLFESFFILPVHLARGKKLESPARRPWLEASERGYGRLLDAALRHRYVVAAAFTALLAGSFAYARDHASFVLFPQDDSEAIYVQVHTPPGTSLEETAAAVSAVERQVAQRLGADLGALSTRIGHEEPLNLTRNRGTAESHAVLIAYVSDRPSRSALTWSRDLASLVTPPPGATLLYDTKLVGPPMGKPVTLHLAADDDDARRAASRRALDYLHANADLTEVTVDERPGKRVLRLEASDERLARRALDSELVALHAALALRGVPATERRDPDGTTPYRVKYRTLGGDELDTVLDAPLRNRLGQLTTLRGVVEPTEADALLAHFHRDGRPTATVSAMIRGGSEETPTSLARRVRAELVPRLEAIPGVTVEVGGLASGTEETIGDMWVVNGLAVAGILVVIAAMLGSLLEAAFVTVAIPFCVVGVLWTLAAHGLPFSMFAMLGLVGLGGVGVNDSIVMFSAMKEREADEPGSMAVVRDAAVSRLRAVILTSVTTAAGVLPTAYGIGGRDQLLSPMSLVLGWGITFVTLVTLILIPVLYGIGLDLRALSRRLRRAGPHEEAPASAGGAADA